MLLLVISLKWVFLLLCSEHHRGSVYFLDRLFEFNHCFAGPKIHTHLALFKKLLYYQSNQSVCFLVFVRIILLLIIVALQVKGVISRPLVPLKRISVC